MKATPMSDMDNATTNMLLTGTTMRLDIPAWVLREVINRFSTTRLFEQVMTEIAGKLDDLP